MTPLLAAVLFQASPWTPPPTRLSKAFVDATAFLLAHGMGDPRGGEFREATIETVGFLRPTQRVEVRGWVVGKRVITTDGLTYRAIKIGKPADLEEELSRRLPEFARPEARGQGFEILIRGGEGSYVTGAVLLVAGRADLAERAVPGDFKPSYATGMFQSFLVGWYHQAVITHEAGQDDETAALGGRLLRERPAFEAEGLRLAGRRWAADDQGRRYETDEQYPFLNPLSVLVKDSERRLAHPRPALDLAALSKRPSAERISTLIDHLDEEAAQQIAQPGTVPFEEDPLIRALVAEGDAAVPTLFEAMARDERLTRSVGYRRVYLPDRSLMTVREAAYAAFRQIAAVRAVPPLTDLPALRAFWETTGKLTPAERQLRLLDDDQAGLFEWTEAERSLFGDGTSPHDRNIPLATALRTTHKALVRDLLARRAKELAGQVDEDRPLSRFKLDLALRLAADLAFWAPQESLPTLRAVTKRAMEPGVPLDWLKHSFARSIVARGDLEGAPAWRAYAGWADGTTRPESDTEHGWGSTEAFRPLLERRNVPELRSETRAVLISSGSPWSVARGGAFGPHVFLASAVRSVAIAQRSGVPRGRSSGSRRHDVGGQRDAGGGRRPLVRRGTRWLWAR